MSELAERLASVHDRIRRAGGDGVVVVGVAKTYGVDAIDAALAGGLYDIGESYAQELRDKLVHFADDDRVRWHFVGGLQRNKVRHLAGRVHLWQSVDRPSLVQELIRREPGAAILVQVNSTDESQKSGCPPAEVETLVEQAADGGLDVQGLMTIGRLDDVAATERGFTATKRLCDQLGLRHCSMGMSGDLERAIGAGSTMVRIGRDIFGARV